MSISLQKNQTVSLKKDNGQSLTNVRMGLGWDAVAAKGGFFGKSKEIEIDLDASALLFAADGRLVDTVYFGQLGSRDGSVRHTGDNLTGAGDGDDESILVDLSRVPAEVAKVVLVVTSYSGQQFSQVQNAHCRVVDESAGGVEIARYSLSGSGSNTGLVMAKLVREPAGWAFTAIGAPANGRVAADLRGLAANA